MARLVRLFTPSLRFVEPSTNFRWTVAGLFASYCEAASQARIARCEASISFSVRHVAVLNCKMART